MRVAISYSDGHYSMYDPSQRSFRDGMTEAEKAAWMRDYTIEIPDEDWKAYRSHVEEDRRWYQHIQKLEGVLYEKRGSP